MEFSIIMLALCVFYIDWKCCSSRYNFDHSRPIAKRNSTDGFSQAPEPLRWERKPLLFIKEEETNGTAVDWRCGDLIHKFFDYKLYSDI